MLLVPLDLPGVPLHRQLYEGVRERILDGRLAPGERLPASRALAHLLGVGRNTVLEAFAMLQAEGYLESRTGSGTFVSSTLPDQAPVGPSVSGPLAVAGPLRLSAWAQRALASGSDPAALATIDPRVKIQFRNGLLPSGPFPWRVWERLAREQLAAPDPSQFQYGQPCGLPALRQAIADYVTRARGVHCDSGQVMVTSGSQGVLDLIARVLLDTSAAVAIEEPGYTGARRAFAASGAELRPVAVDGSGLRPEQLPTAARLLYLTPSHQFPTGGVLPIARRLAILEWAQRVDAWVLEDDYDSEYRYGGRPLAAMQGLDPERVVYCGTFSKALYPGFRVGFLIGPTRLIEVLADVRSAIDRQPPSLDQLLMAAFLNEGHFERHLRRMRVVYSEKRAGLRRALRAHLPAWQWDDSGAGLHLYVRLPAGAQERETIERAAEAGIGLFGASQYYLAPDRAPPGLVLGYAHLTTEEIEGGTARLGKALGDVCSRTPSPRGRGACPELVEGLG